MMRFSLGKSYSVKFSQDNLLLASISGGKLIIWDLNTSNPRFVFNPIRNASSLDLHGNHLAVKNTSGKIIIVDLKNGTVLSTFYNKKNGEGSNLLFSDGGESIIDGSWNRNINLIDLATMKQTLIKSYEKEMICRILYSNMTKKWIFEHHPKAKYRDKPPEETYFTIWDWPLQEQRLNKLNCSYPFARSSALSNQGDRLAVLYGAPPISIEIISIPECEYVISQNVLIGGSGSKLSWSPDGNILGSVQDSKIAFYINGGRELVKEIPLKYPSDVAFSPNGKYVALGSWTAGLLLETELLFK